MANSLDLKKRNILDIINTMKYKRVVTKPDIVRMTGLTPATIHNSINELLARKIVIEDGIADSTGGRKAFLYRLNAKMYYIVGVDIGDSYLSAGLFDFELNIINKASINYALCNHSVEDGLESLLSLIERVIEESNVEKEKILGIGVSVSGPVDYKKGKIYQVTSAPRWRNIPLAKIIEDRLEIPTVIDRDNNNTLLYLAAKEISRDNKNIVLLSTRKGIGTGITIDGKVYRGKHSLAGELGHVIVEPAGEKCNCGKIGCIEPLASDPSIINFAVRRIKNGEKTVITHMCNGELNSINIQMMIEAAKSQDALARELFMKTAFYLSICIGNIIKIYDPDEIIFECVWLRELGDIYNYLINKVYEDNEFINRDELKISLNREEDIILNGAATLIIEQNLKSFESSRFLI